MARPGWGGVWAVGVVRARGGVGTHWQPLNTFSPRKCKPSVGSGEEMRARWGGGAGESAGGCGHTLAAFKYSLNIQAGVGSGEAGVVWCGREGW